MWEDGFFEDWHFKQYMRSLFKEQIFGSAMYLHPKNLYLIMFYVRLKVNIHVHFQQLWSFTPEVENFYMDIDVIDYWTI